MTFVTYTVIDEYSTLVRTHTIYPNRKIVMISERIIPIKKVA